jgi:hypothetical protein
MGNRVEVLVDGAEHFVRLHDEPSKPTTRNTPGAKGKLVRRFGRPTTCFVGATACCVGAIEHPIG